MELQEAIDLIRHPDLMVTNKPAVWADLGCGSGLFSYALATLLPQHSVIHAVDKAILPRHEQRDTVTIQFHHNDFVKDDLGLPALDGILMANSLHYVKDQLPFLTKAKQAMKPHAPFIIVEYNITKSNTWVPYPVNFQSLQKLFTSIGYTSIEKTHERPSRFHTEQMYAAFIR